MILVVLAASWKQISYNFLFFVAGLQSIPTSLKEAAAIDGAEVPGRPDLAEGAHQAIYLPAAGLHPFNRQTGLRTD